MHLRDFFAGHGHPLVELRTIQLHCLSWFYVKAIQIVNINHSCHDSLESPHFALVVGFENCPAGILGVACLFEVGCWLQNNINYPLSKRFRIWIFFEEQTLQGTNANGETILSMDERRFWIKKGETILSIDHNMVQSKHIGPYYQSIIIWSSQNILDHIINRS